MESEQFEGRTILVGGGTSGIGLGLDAMTRHVAAELAEHRIRMNSVSPAIVETRTFERFIPKEQLSGALDGFNNFHPLGRNGTSRDVAETVN